MDGVRGFDDVMKNLNDQIHGIKNRSMAGLLEAGLKIEAASNTRVPRQYGNLAGSSYTRAAQDGSLSVEVGYTASYAVYVHENLEMKLHGEPRSSGLSVYWGPNGENKFLEKTVTMNEKAIVDIVMKRAKIDEQSG
jgi:hypothetical protein